FADQPNPIKMVDARTTDAYRAMLGIIGELGSVASPRTVHAAMIERHFSAADVYRAFQLALSRNAIRIDAAMQIQATARAEAQAA
ncbi:hypothetical protein OMR07_18620, partial [Methylobacterium organophilum]|nr:hypothetical protein [Methylobacterium organophilum]